MHPTRSDADLSGHVEMTQLPPAEAGANPNGPLARLSHRIFSGCAPFVEFCSTAFSSANERWLPCLRTPHFDFVPAQWRYGLRTVSAAHEQSIFCFRRGELSPADCSEELEQRDKYLYTPPRGLDTPFRPPEAPIPLPNSPLTPVTLKETLRSTHENIDEGWS
jgi:hypothetical protein